MLAESQPRESQIPPTSNLWLSRNVSKHATVVAPRRNFHIFHYASMYSFPYRCAISRLEATRRYVRSNIRSFDRRWIVTKSHFVWGYHHHREHGLMGAEKFWSKVSETRGDPDNLYPWNFARIRLSAASGATKNVKRETARVYAVCGDLWRVGLLSFRAIQMDHVDSLQIYYCYWFGILNVIYFILRWLIREIDNYRIFSASINSSFEGGCNL